MQHAGRLGLAEEYHRNPGARPPLMDAMSGTPPAATFNYLRASALDYDPVQPGNWNSSGRNAATNLVGLPVESWYHVLEPPYVHGFVANLEQILGATHRSVPSLVPAPPHTCAVIDDTEICDFFAAQTFDVPDSGRVRFARDARYHDMWLTRRITSTFGDITFKMSPAPGSSIVDRLSFTLPENVGRVEVDATASNIARTISIETGRAPQNSWVLRIRNFGADPAAVLLNSGPTTRGQDWEVTAGTLILVARSGSAGADDWQIL